MQFKKIISLCKKHKKIIRFDAAGRQWCGDGQAYFCLDGFPTMSRDEIIKVFDISQDDESKYIIADRDERTALLDFRDAGVPEYDVAVSPYPFVCASGEYIPGMIDGQIHLIDDDYRAAFGGGCTMFARRAASGEMYIAVRRGIFLEGLIFPSNDLTMTFERWIDKMHELIHGGERQ